MARTNPEEGSGQPVEVVRRPPVLAGAAVILALVAAAAGWLAVLERDIPPAPSPPVTVALPERPAPEATRSAPPDPVETPRETAQAPADEEASPPPDEPVAAPVPGLVLALGGLAWNPALAEIAHRAMPAEIAFTVAVDHPELSEHIGAWRDLGRDVLLRAPGEADVDALLARHPGAAGVVLDGRRLEPRRGSEGLAVRSLDASLMDYTGFARALREVMQAARDLPPPVVVIELYPGLVPQLQGWLEQLDAAGYRIWRPLELGEAMGE
ncbi:MAG: hypothetical protein ACOCYE_05040 [Pseudomonadota bacterium]